MTREQIIHDLEALKEYFCEQSGGCAPVCLEEAVKALEKKPTGEWEKTFSHNGKSYHRCTNCHVSSQLILVDNFCPYCGAKMKGDNT